MSSLSSFIDFLPILFVNSNSVPTGLEDVSTYPALFAELISRGYTEEELGKIAQGNLLRVMKKIEKVRDQLAYLPPYEEHLQPPLKDKPCRPNW